MRSFLYVFVRLILFWPVILFLRVRMRGRKNEPKRSEGPYLVCANHQSVLDVMFLAVALKHQQPHFMAKESLFRVPVWRGLMRALGAFPVSRRGNDVGAIKHTIRLLESGRSIGIFPQGTRCAEKELRDCRVKAGAGMVVARTGVPVLPVYIGMKNHKWKLFRRVTVVVGEPIPFESFGYDKEQPGEYMRITNEIYDKICALEESVKK